MNGCIDSDNFDIFKAARHRMTAQVALHQGVKPVGTSGWLVGWLVGEKFVELRGRGLP